MIYLMRHLHAADAQFLESFRDRGVARAGAVHTIAVISRADEIGGGRVDAMFAARGIAQRYRADPTMRGLCQNVVAVAGLIAETGRTLRQSEFAALAALAALPKTDLESQLRSVDRFLRGPDPAGRRKLLAALRDLRHPAVHQPGPAGRRPARPRWPPSWSRRSGLGELQRVLHTQFMQRRDLLKARSALLAVDSVLRTTGRGEPAAPATSSASWPARTSWPSCGCSRRCGPGWSSCRRAPPRRPNGCSATPARPAATRLGLAPDDRRRTSCAGRRSPRWTAGSGTPMNPMFGRTTADACRVVVRSCEGVLAGLHSLTPAQPAGASAAGRAEPSADQCRQTGGSSVSVVHTPEAPPRPAWASASLRGSPHMMITRLSMDDIT